MTEAVTRIAMWSGPRNLSTAMMRSWENRADTAVMDEPLYAAYLAATGVDHPAAEQVIAAGPADAGDGDRRVPGAAPPGVAISYQKHMAHHLLPEMDRSWLDRLSNCSVDPRPAARARELREGASEVTLADIGLPQQVELARHCELVIDSDDFLGDPQPI